MPARAKVIADSISEAGARLTTLEVVMPRIILAEFNTHRMFSRNSASSRAIPIHRMIERVEEDPYIPVFLANQKGMQAGAPLAAKDAAEAHDAWVSAKYAAVAHAMRLMETGAHKQWTNRLLEPFLWHTVIVTATEWDNFFHLRDNPDAHPDIQIVARKMREAMEASTPQVRKPGEWHLPYVQPDEVKGLLIPEVGDALKLSTARCARVSYLTHDGKRDHEVDFALHDKLLTSGHMSPLEHPAMATLDAKLWDGNFRGWCQYRKRIPGEYDILGNRG